MTTAKTQLCKTWVRVTSVAFVALAAFSAQADTFMFDRGWRWPDSNPIGWSSSVNWWLDLGTGTAPTRIPNGPDDVVCLTNNPFLKQVFRLGDSSAATAIEVGTLVGYPDRSLWFPSRGSTALLNHTFTVSNPDGFGGFFDAGDSGAEIVLKATSSRSPDLSHVIASNRVYLTVADAGTAASVRSVQGGGAIDKKGDGNLTVHSAGGVGTKIYVKDGSLALDGVSGPVDSPAPGALYHFDASRIDTMTYSVDGSRTNVTRWASLGGTGMYAYRPTNIAGTGSSKIHYANAPFISKAVSPTGLPLMDFGSVTVGGVAEFGPTNCVFGLSYVGTVDNVVTQTGSPKVREVFYAGCRSQSSESTLFGGYTEQDWLPGGDKYRWNEGSAAKHVLAGEHWLNGRATENCINAAYFPGRSHLLFHVYGCAATNDTTVRYLGTDRLGPTKTGGWRVGEILMYTNALTRAERARVNRYLVKKWLGSDDCDVGAVMVADGAGSLGVPSGHTAKVRRVAAEGGTLVKSGEGRLEIDHLHPATVSIDVQGGSLAVTSGNSPVSANPQPASGAYLWLDAEHGLTVTNAAGTADFVVKWSDRRGDGYGVYAEIPADSAYYSGRAPYVVPGAANGHDVVSFVHDNSNSSDYQSWMRIVPSGDNGYEAFVALRFANRGTTPSVFGSTSTLLQCEYRHLLNTTSAGPLVAAGLWTADGVPCDPWTYAIPGTEAYHVYSVSLSEKHAFDLLAKSTIRGTAGVGMLEIGEYIVYERRLTDAERRDTVAYLMEKWTGAKSPEAEGRLHVGTLSFADGVDPVLESDDNATIAAVIEGNELPEAASKRIVENLAFFEEQMREPDFDACTLWDGLRRLSVIACFEDNPDYAQEVFESANSKGLPLTLADMVRNYLLLEESPAEQERLYDEYWAEAAELFEPDPGSTRLNAAITAWICIRFRARRVGNSEYVYSTFKRYVADEFQGTRESVLLELRAFCYMWREQYRYHAIRKYLSKPWAVNGAATLTQRFRRKKAENTAYAESLWKKFDAADDKW